MLISRARRGVSVLAATVMALQPAYVYAQQPLPPVRPDSLPQNGQVTAGSASLAKSGPADAPTLTVNQTSQRAAISWSSFDLGSNATMTFNQPDASSVALNRVQSSDPSQIFGHMTANGQVYLVNPNGVY
jgi:filamentous hemagglutinin family protein